MGLFEALFGEIVRLEALADQTAEHIDHADEDRVDLATGDRVPQIIECQLTCQENPLVKTLRGS